MSSDALLVLDPDLRCRNAAGAERGESVRTFSYSGRDVPSVSIASS